MELSAAGLVWKHADGEKFQNFLTDSIKTAIDRSQREDYDAMRFVELLQLHVSIFFQNKLHFKNHYETQLQL
ncbi:UNVERIFIED_CONTAM: hypothetical protein NCL1_48239 [Trichonephila clavipes]